MSTFSKLYCQDWQLTQRYSGGIGLVGGALELCSDPNCDLSGGYAHAGPCEPCGCPARHAVQECPLNGSGQGFMGSGLGAGI
jgi:hypothetical protein